MVYTRNQPVATDDLSVSQPIVAVNTNAADDSFGVDHFPFSNLTSSNGFHQKVTIPGNVAIPTPASGFGDMFAITSANTITRPFWVSDALAVQFSMIPIKAFGTFSNTGTIIGNAMNLTACTHVSTGEYIVNIVPNAVDPLQTSNYTILATSNQAGSVPNIVIQAIPTNQTTAGIVARISTNATLVDPSQFSVMILQY